jgi:hypothetical protein
MARIKDVNLYLRARPTKNIARTRLGYSLLRLINRVSLFFSSSPKGGEFSLVKVPEFDERINVFSDSVMGDYDFILEKKRDYLNWRFSNEGRGTHQILLAMEGDRIIGYAVLGQKVDEGYVEGQIEDLLALKGRLDVVDALFSFACSYFDDLGINGVFYQVVEGHPYCRVSERWGFLNSRSRPTVELSYSEVYVKQIGKTKIEFLQKTDPSRIYFNYAETI